MTTTPRKTAPRKPTIQVAPVDLAKLANPNEAITVRNTLDTIAVFVLREGGNDQISEFGPSGDPFGEDVMELPSTYLKNAAFRKQLQKGIFEVIEADDPAVLDAIAAQKSNWEAKQSAKFENDSLIAKQEVRAFSGVECIAQEGRLQCSEFAIRSNQNERPPLCSKHAHLASQFIPEETGTFRDGKPEIRWGKLQLNR